MGGLDGKTMGVNPAQLTVGGVFQERYEVLRCIATGGMGAVYEVIDVETHRRRALKVMLPREDEDGTLRDRFRREATVAAQVESEHIAETIDAGVDSKTGAPFLVMELLKGEDLGETVQRRGALPAEEVVIYLWQASLALDKTHAAHVVHRDLKPENLFVTRRDDGSPCIKLLDFGIAKTVETEGDLEDTTQGNGVIGTPLYLSPEQVRGRIAPLGKTDRYALGQIAYTLLTGQPYWAAEQESAEDVFPILMAVAHGPPQRAGLRALERTGIELPAKFDSWFKKATATDPDERFESCAELVDSLADALGAEQPGTASMLSLPPPAEIMDQAIAGPSQAGAEGDAMGGSSAQAAGHRTDQAVTRTIPGASGRSRWPAVAAIVLLLGGLGWGASKLMGGDQVAKPGPAGGATETPSPVSAPVSASSPVATPTASASSGGPLAATASASATSSSARPTATVPRPKSTTPRLPTPPTTATGWVPPVVER